MEFRLGESVSDYLTREMRELGRIRGVLITYKEERGRFGDIKNVNNMIDQLNDLVLSMENEIETAKQYEEWINE